MKNVNLPAYVMRRSGRFYLEPKGRLLEKLGGRRSFPLGGSYMEMFAGYKVLMDLVGGASQESIITMFQLIDRYLLEITPTKAESSRNPEIRRCNFLKRVFGHMRPEQVTKVDIYGYIDWRSRTGAPVGVNREVALLSAIFKKAERWGIVTDNPCVRIEYNKEKPRNRYITHEEYKAFREFVNKRNPVVACYMDFKYITGLRAGDLRNLKKSKISEEGLYLKIGKNGQERLMEWSPTLRQVTQNLIDACGREKLDKNGNIERARVHSEYLLHTRTGMKYSRDGWCSIFYRLMRKAVDQGVLKEWFREHDIRAKAGSDHESLEKASKFLAHLSVKVTADHYRRRMERIQPLM